MVYHRTTRKKSHSNLNVKSPEQVEALDYIADYLGESRSVAARDIIRRGIESFYRENGLNGLDDLVNLIASGVSDGNRRSSTPTGGDATL